MQGLPSILLLFHRDLMNSYNGMTQNFEILFFAYKTQNFGLYVPLLWLLRKIAKYVNQ